LILSGTYLLITQHGGSGVFLNVTLSTELTYRFTNMANTSDDGERAAALTNLWKIVRPPTPLNLGAADDKIETWRCFQTRWNNFVLLSSLEKVDRRLQVAQLQNCLGDHAFGGFQIWHSKLWTYSQGNNGRFGKICCWL